MKRVVDSAPNNSMASIAPGSPRNPSTQVQKVDPQQPRSSPRRAVRRSPRRASGEEQAACPPTQIRSLAAHFEQSSLSVPSTRSSPRKVAALMAEEACAPTSRMRSLAKCFEELSSANVPPDSLAPPQPKAGEEVPSYYMPAEMLPPRESRLNVREQRKEAIFTSSTLDFVSLSACGDLSGFSGGDLSLSLPACGESTLQSRMPTPRCEEGPQQARASPGRKRRCSQESLAEEMSARSYHGEAASAKKARQHRHALSPSLSQACA